MSRQKILLVDDNVLATRSIKSGLERRANLDVRVVNDSREALAVAKGFRPDLVLCDIMMPDKDGGDVATEMKDDTELATVPFIFLSGILTPNEQDAMADAGVEDEYTLLAKPITARELSRIILEKLQQAKAA